MSKILKNIKPLLAILILIPFTRSYAQELTMPYLEGVYQASYMDPSAVPDHKLSIGLPGLSSVQFNLVNQGFKASHLFERRGNTLHLDPWNLHNHLARTNLISASSSIDLFHIRVKARHMFLSFHVQENVNFRFSYPRDMFRLLQGNANYIGETLDMTSLGVKGSHYREYAIGVVRAKEKNPLVLGGRFKLLQGLSNVHFRNERLTFETGDDMYPLSVNVNSVMNYAGPWSEDMDIDERFIYDYMTNFQNRGAAIDLGATYKYNERLTFSAAINNVGFIKWRNNVHNYRVEGSASFEGVDARDYFYQEEVDFDEMLDSLGNLFTVTETNNAYTTWLTPQIYLRTRYRLLEKTEAGFLFYMNYYKAARPGFSLSLSQEAGKIFQGVLSYSSIYRSFDNIGLALMFKPGPVQFYMAAENVFRVWRQIEVDGETYAVVPMKAKFLTFRFGMNLVFGRIRTIDKLPVLDN